MLETNWILRQIFRREGKCSPPSLVFPSSESTPRSFRRRTPRLRSRVYNTTGVTNVKKQDGRVTFAAPAPPLPLRPTTPPLPIPEDQDSLGTSTLRLSINVEASAALRTNARAKNTGANTFIVLDVESTAPILFFSSPPYCTAGARRASYISLMIRPRYCIAVVDGQ